MADSEGPGGRGPAREGPGVGRTFLRLGTTSFGGPVAHLGFFRTEVVERRRWLTDGQYADLVALGQFLPGPASSQVGIGIGLVRGGLPGSLRAWLGFTAPSAVVMIAAGLAVGGGVVLADGMLAGLKVAAVAVVAHAVWMMARTLARGWLRAALAVGTAVAVLAVPTVWMPTLALATCGLIGVLAIRDARRDAAATDEEVLVPDLPRWLPTAALVAFTLLLLGLPIAARAWPGEWTTLLAGFYRAGALVFGGGHVVLPMLEEVVVGSGAVSSADFVAGYGLANAVPGPLFTFAGYLGASAGGVQLGIAAVVAIFLPGFLLVVGVLGHWHVVSGDHRVRRALAGVNAAVVGLLAAALYDPVITAGITGWRSAALAAVALVGLAAGRAAPHVVVLACALAGWLLLD